MSDMPGPTAVPLLSCSDQPGVLAATTDFVYRHGGNILDAQQHTDRTDGVFFQRVEFLLEGCDLARDEIEPAFAPIIERFGMRPGRDLEHARWRRGSGRAVHTHVEHRVLVHGRRTVVFDEPDPKGSDSFQIWNRALPFGVSSAGRAGPVRRHRSGTDRR